MDLDSHDLLLAKGLACESYLDAVNRASFTGARVIGLNPRFGGTGAAADRSGKIAAPPLVSRERVEPIWGQLARRSTALGYAVVASVPACGSDPGLTVELPDGRLLATIPQDALRHRVTIPAGVSVVRLRSRAAPPSEIEGPFLDDRRRLGVGVQAAWVSGAALDLQANDVAVSGRHAVETDGLCSWRWTDGDTVLRLPASTRPVELRLDLQAVFRYPVDTANAA